VDFLLLGAGFFGAYEAVKILAVIFGWRGRPAGFDNDVAFVALCAVALGIYVGLQASRRMTDREKTREHMLAEFHDKAERARAASKQS